MYSKMDINNRYCEVNHIKSRQHKVCEEVGELDYDLNVNMERTMNYKTKVEQVIALVLFFAI